MILTSAAHCAETFLLTLRKEGGGSGEMCLAMMDMAVVPS
jgi:hypothetical protein